MSDAISDTIVAAEKVVFLKYTLRNDAGEILDASGDDNPLLYLHGASNIVPGLESALTGKAVGESLKVAVPAAEGYGERHEGASQKVPRAAFGEVELDEGMQLVGEDENGTPFPFWIATVGDEEVEIDLNHPLAGMTLHFEVTIQKLRDATAPELEHGHPHGATGHEAHGH